MKQNEKLVIKYNIILEINTEAQFTVHVGVHVIALNDRTHYIKCQTGQV